MKDYILREQNKIEFHYYLEGNSHSINAKTLHSCNTELLGILNKLSNFTQFDYNIETVALEEGGVKQIWSFVSEYSSQVTMILTLLMILLMLRPSQDKELTQLQKENLRLQNQKIELEIENLKNKEIGDKIESTSVEIINEDQEIIVHKSKFYESLEKELRVVKFETNTFNKDNKIINTEIVKRDEFIYYIKHKDDLPELIDEYAKIEVIAPVLLNRKYKWKGLYNGEIIDFYMGEKEFKKDIENGDIAFKSGSLIKCVLIQKRKINEIGIEYITTYSVKTVLGVSDNGTHIETVKGKIKRIIDKEKKDQLKLEF